MPAPPATPSVAPSAPRPHALDEAIERFWDDFVRRQAATGRRDVARMLEVALEFFFERSTQISEQDTQRRGQLEQFLALVRAELSRLQPIFAAAVARFGTGDGALPAPYLGVEVTLGDGRGVSSRPLAEPIARLAPLRPYHALLERQIGAAEAALADIIDRMVKTRAVVAERLKVLSPRLYAHGQVVVGAMPAGGADDPEVGAALPRLDVPAVAAAAAAAATAAASTPQRAPWWVPVWRRLRDAVAITRGSVLGLWQKIRRIGPGQLRQAGAEALRRDRDLEETLAAFERKVQEWDR